MLTEGSRKNLRLKLLAMAAMLVAGLSVAAWSSSDSAARSSSSAAPSSSSAASATCGGPVPTRLPADPHGVLKTFPKFIRDSYTLFPRAAVGRSAWANWKPKHRPPYSIFVLSGNYSTPFGQGLAATLKALDAKSPLVSRLILQSSDNNVQVEIGQIQQAISQKVDLAIILPTSAPAEEAAMERLGRAGIPVIAPLNSAGTNNPYIVGLEGNNPLIGAALTRALVAAMGGRGSMLHVHGILGPATDSEFFAGAEEYLKQCPNINVAGSIVGSFAPAPAKAATLQFLAAHPQRIDGVLSHSGMAVGVMQAFQQTGRTIPPVADVGPTPGALGYWYSNFSTYKGAALAKGGSDPACKCGSSQLAAAAWYLAVGLLEGRGIKITDISQYPRLITKSNLARWVRPEWNLNTTGALASGPPGSIFPPSYLNRFFTHPPK